mgnify:CR=1 FL=1
MNGDGKRLGGGGIVVGDGGRGVMQVANRAAHEFGVTAVAVQAEEDAVRAGVRAPPLADPASAARHERVRYDTVADVPAVVVDVRAEGLDDAGKLVDLLGVVPARRDAP